MNLSSAPVSNRYHIGFFGCTNAGKSSLINAFLNQEVSIVSPRKGTTTDAVNKTMELLPYGPVVVFDTAGIDDVDELGKLRIEKTKEILRKTDIAVLVIDLTQKNSKKNDELINHFEKHKIPYIIAYNKADLINDRADLKQNEIYVSAKSKENINKLKELVGRYMEDKKQNEKYIVKDILNPKDTVILVIPIDTSAPKGRLILPQQLVLRELLDSHIKVICVQTEELKETLDVIKPNLVITDSQAFKKVKDIVPKEIKLTSFSILFARYKGELETFKDGLKKLADLKDNDTILISEGCSHHRQCEDIGSVKIPKWLSDFTNKKLNFEFSSGNTFKNDLTKYSLIIHCGGCMLNEKEMKARIDIAKKQNIPIVNYGILISYINGILKRTLEIFKG